MDGREGLNISLTHAVISTSRGVEAQGQLSANAHNGNQ